MKIAIASLMALLLTGCFHKEVIIVKHLPIPSFLLEPCTLPEALPVEEVVTIRDLLVEMQVRQGDHIECAKKLGRIMERERKLTEEEAKKKAP